MSIALQDTQGLFYTAGYNNVCTQTCSSSHCSGCSLEQTTTHSSLESTKLLPLCTCTGNLQIVHTCHTHLQDELSSHLSTGSYSCLVALPRKVLDCSADYSSPLWHHIGHQSLSPTITFSQFSSHQLAVGACSFYPQGVTAVVHGWLLMHWVTIWD